MKTPLAANDNEKLSTHANDNKKLGTIRPLDPSDPRSIDHPSQRPNWSDLMEELGRLMAGQEWERLHSQEGKIDGTQGSGSIRPVFERPTKRALNR